VIPGVGYVCVCIVEAEHEGDVWVLYQTYDVSDPGECRKIRAELKSRYKDAVCEVGTG
jgi:hypothetical protein